MSSTNGSGRPTGVSVFACATKVSISNFSPLCSCSAYQFLWKLFVIRLRTLRLLIRDTILHFVHFRTRIRTVAFPTLRHGILRWTTTRTVAFNRVKVRARRMIGWSPIPSSISHWTIVLLIKRFKTVKCVSHSSACPNRVFRNSVVQMKIFSHHLSIRCVTALSLNTPRWFHLRSPVDFDLNQIFSNQANTQVPSVDHSTRLMTFQICTRAFRCRDNIQPNNRNSSSSNNNPIIDQLIKRNINLNLNNSSINSNSNSNLCMRTKRSTIRTLSISMNLAYLPINTSRIRSKKKGNSVSKVRFTFHLSLSLSPVRVKWSSVSLLRRKEGILTIFN